MPLFSDLFWTLVILLIFSVIFSSIFLAVNHKKDSIRGNLLYFLILSILIILSKYSELIIFNNFNSSEIVLIFDIELVLVLFLFSLLYLVVKKKSHSDHVIYLFSIVILLTFHIFFSGIIGILLEGTIIICLIGTLVFTVIIPYDIEYKLFTSTGILALTMYISLLIGEFNLALLILGLISLTILISTESLRNRLVSLYQTSVLSLKKIISKIFGPFHKNSFDQSSDLEEKNQISKKKKILFWQSRVKIIQGPLGQKPDKQDVSKENYKTWLQDFFSNKSRYGLKLVSQRDFAWTFLMRAKTEVKARIQGETLLTRLLNIFSGTDGNLDIIPITKRKLYKNNRIWEIKLPTHPYRENFTIIKDFINLYLVINL